MNCQIFVYPGSSNFARFSRLVRVSTPSCHIWLNHRLFRSTQFCNSVIRTYTNTIRSNRMNNFINTLESCWYISPPWGKEIPPLVISLLERVYLPKTKIFGYCCGVEWSADGWCYSIALDSQIVSVSGIEIVSSGQLQALRLPKPTFMVGELLTLPQQTIHKSLSHFTHQTSLLAQAVQKRLSLMRLQLLQAWFLA